MKRKNNFIPMEKFKKLFLFLIVSSFTLNIIFSNTMYGNEKIAAFKKSVVAEEIKNYSKALDYIIMLYDDFKEDYLVNLRLGWLYYLNKDYKLSEKYYKEAIRISNKSPESLLGLAYPLFAAGKMDELISTYKTILKEIPNSFQANYRLGLIYFNKKDYLNAKKYFGKIHETFPSNYFGNLYLGWTYYYLGSNKNAHKLFINALIAKPDKKSAIEGYNLTK